MDIIGIAPGDYVVIKSITKKKRIRALEITPTLEKKLKKRMKKDKDDFNCSKRLNLKEIESNKSDLDPIYIDFDARKELEVDQCHPIQIQRSIRSVIKKKLHHLATPLIITTLDILLTFDYFENQDTI